MVARLVRDEEVVGSNPACPTANCSIGEPSLDPECPGCYEAADMKLR